MYQHSSYPVAILESYIGTQDQLNAFASLFTGEIIKLEELDHLEEVLEVLVKDNWFQRALTLQEAASSGSTIRLLIGCPPHLTKPTSLGDINGDIEISLFDLQNAMVTARNYMEEFLSLPEFFDDGQFISISNLANDLYELLPNTSY